jgi:nicotinate-nucleotide--dimethylbenzimidazole phosphoribosyltransferase
MAFGATMRPNGGPCKARLLRACYWRPPLLHTPPPSLLEPEAIAAFPDEAREALYKVIALRRDVRHFRPDEVDPAVLERILGAAHRAPSVGLSQPWGFVVVRERGQRSRIRESFLRCREAESVRFPPGRRDAYLAHKLEGILEAPLNLCVAVDLRDREGAILGTTAQPEAVRASACCAVENLWLAARAEGIGVGWVSIVEPQVLRSELALPAGVEPIAYLCVGHPVAFRERPMLEETGWGSRRPLASAVHADGRWEDPRPGRVAPPVAAAGPSRSRVPPADATARAAARAHHEALAKPAGSLGVLEELAVFYAGSRGAFPPSPVDSVVLALFAADHGVVVEGVSAYGSQLTAAVVGNVMAGSAAINAIAGESRVDLVLVDVGIAGDTSTLPSTPVVPLRRERVRAGTANLRVEDAMSRADAVAAIEAGARIARDAAAAGASVIALGEIGIGNTAASAALASALLGLPPAAVVGRGTGIDDDVLGRKIAVVTDALARRRHDPADPVGSLAAVGGLEIAAIVGCVLEAARRRIPAVLDGFVTNVAALVAARLDPNVRDHLVASHVSPEPGAALVLSALGCAPLLDLRMRLGEGTGAALATTLLRAAVQAQRSMATFATAGIVGRSGLGKAR